MTRSTPTIEEAIANLLADDSFRKAFESANDQPAIVADSLKEKGYVFNVEECKAGLAKLASGELPEELLAKVAGGGVLIRK